MIFGRNTGEFGTTVDRSRHLARKAWHALAFGIAGVVLLSDNPGLAADPVSSGPDTSINRVIGAHGHIGAVNVILVWNTHDDLDVQVTCPNGERIYYAERNKCGGMLDVDMNSNAANASGSPVENVTWPADAAPPGTYKVAVDLYHGNSSRPVAFKVELFINGELKEEYARRFEAPGKIAVFEFSLPYAGPRR